MSRTLPAKRLTLPAFSAAPACRTADPELFFRDRRDDDALAAARAVCHRCPVKAECLAWATKHDVFGVWGGTTRTQRTRRRNP